jgi:UDP-N-acetyl-D-galactosamine dehydrogenase
LKDYNCQVDVYDPWVSVKEVEQEYGVIPIEVLNACEYDAVILAVAHDEFKTLGEKGIKVFGKPNSVLYDLKYILTEDDVDLRL